MKSEHHIQWQEAISEELRSLKEAQTWNMVDPPKISRDFHLSLS